MHAVNAAVISRGSFMRSCELFLAFILQLKQFI